MPRKEVITKNEILRCAFELAREEGIAEVTARKLANKVGCSTQPIFRAYHNMDEVLGDVMDHSIRFFERFYAEYPRETAEVPFLNLGMAYIGFAKEEKNLFHMMFLREGHGGRSLYELINGVGGNVMREIQLAKSLGCPDPEGLFMKMWIFIHGAASMTITGDYDLNRDDTRKMIQEVYASFKA
ncbi:MAG: TetR/AcrR family transcriptional regulator [Lachnospiraceae bacterium]|jgi:AcrR family transcriptional regulator|nr:TetR/AcrR family transcriptional regulator [Lachnospiraceae bacterium]